VKPVVTKNFTWDVQYNVAWNHNEITSLAGNTGDEDYRIVTGETISRGNATNIMAHHVGQPASSFWVYQQVYDADGKPLEGVYVDRNADGQINDKDRYYYKKPAADVIMGLTTKFIYKRWDLSMAFHASLGNYVYYNYMSDKVSISPSGLYLNSAFSNTFPEAVALGFTGEGTEYYLSDYFVRNASYLKFSNITLGYSFPTWKRNGNTIIEGGRIFFTAQNPFFITKYKGLDPEVSSGVDKNPYPRPMSFQLGVSLTFM
jgi:iron complex outermembrane receptor protein